MIKFYTFFLILGIVFYCALNTSSLVVFAENISNFVEIKNNSNILSKETIYKIKSITKEMFGDVNVSSNKYLYNLVNSDKQFVAECFIEDGILTVPYLEIYNSGEGFYLLPIMPNGQAIEFVPSDIFMEYTAKIYV